MLNRELKQAPQFGVWHREDEGIHYQIITSAIITYSRRCDMILTPFFTGSNSISMFGFEYSNFDYICDLMSDTLHYVGLVVEYLGISFLQYSLYSG